VVTTLSEATRALGIAERELEASLAELTVADRADKVIVGERLRVAVAELTAARSKLEAVLAMAGNPD
jgi:hypothetical protein